jgi:hypothetical protein
MPKGIAAAPHKVLSAMDREGLSTFIPPSRRAHFSIDIVELGLDDRLQLSATRERLGAQTVDHW